MPDRHADETLADLARHPGWEILEQRARERQEREAGELTRYLLRHPDQLDPLKLARARGFWAGQRWVLRHARQELSVSQREHADAHGINRR